MRALLWLVMTINASTGGSEPTDRLVPPGWQGNPWGPAATAARKSGQLPAIPETSEMKQWDQWGRKVLKSGDILFRRGNARILGGLFPFSRFIANISGSEYSHMGTVVFEDGEPIVYDTTKASVRRQPLKVWVLDTVGAFGVKRLKAPYQNRVPKVIEYLNKVYRDQVPFDYELLPDDRDLYCVEMAEKAFRHAGLTLSQPVLLADMENIDQFPLCVLGFTSLTKLKLDQAVFFPGNERHGIWASPLLETIYPTPSTRAAKPSMPPLLAPAAPTPSPTPAKPAAPRPKSVAGRPSADKPRD